MYNRYIPQADGSYRRSRMQEPNRRVPPQRPQTPPKQEEPHPLQAEEKTPCPPQQETPKPIPCHQPPKQESKECRSDSKSDDRPQKQEEHSHRPTPCQQGGSVGGFLRQLLPKDFDTGDLLVVLLLLLMAGDCAEDQNTALLTLALYFFM